MTPQPLPAVPGIPAGWGALQADFDLWVTDSFSFLSQPANFRAQLQGAQALTGNAFNNIHFGATTGDVLEDPYGGWSTTATASQPAYSWLCPSGCSGWYEASLSAFTASQGSGTTNQLVSVIALNGALWQYGSDDWAVASAPSGSNGPVQVPLGPGDYVQVWIFTTQSVSTPTTAGELPAIELAWVSS